MVYRFNAKGNSEKVHYVASTTFTLDRNELFRVEAHRTKILRCRVCSYLYICGVNICLYMYVYACTNIIMALLVRKLLYILYVCMFMQVLLVNVILICMYACKVAI